MTLPLSIEVRVWRGEGVESRHRLQAAVARPDGVLSAATAEPGLVTTFRSAAKPFQLLPLVERGHADRFGFRDEELAVMAGSHSGSPYHVERVAGILARIGCTESDLACGAHDPLDPVSLDHVRRHPEAASALYNNCSGKHAGMLALALAEGWPIQGYQRADHPLQQLMHRTVAEMCGLEPEAVAVAVDGCSVSVFILPLSAMARAWARLATARPEGGERERALHRIRANMVTWPRATCGAGRLSADLMEHTGGRVVAKGGAEGLECAGLVDRGLGLAVKCEDGGARALAPAIVGLLERLDALTEPERERLAERRHPVLRNHAGVEVGHLSVEIGPAVPAHV